MFTLAYPWILVLLPLPVLLHFLLPPFKQEKLALRVPWFDRLARLLNKKPASGAVVEDVSVFNYICGFMAWILVILALARPQFIEPPVDRLVPVRDLMLLVDLSGSMETKDFTNAAGDPVERLTAVKEVLDDFLERRKGDRVGLIVFGNAAFVQVPFTEDLEACRLLLQETAVRMAGPRTAFGDAIGLGITLFERSEVEERVMIALTDGNDTGSKLPPYEAAKIARDMDITIHVVGAGDSAATGEEKLDEEALKAVVEATGGKYFHGEDRAQLEQIYSELDSVMTREAETESYRPRRDLFHWPIAIFLLAGMAFHVIKLILTRGREDPQNA